MWMIDDDRKSQIAALFDCLSILDADRHSVFRDGYLHGAIDVAVGNIYVEKQGERYFIGDSRDVDDGTAEKCQNSDTLVYRRTSDAC